MKLRSLRLQNIACFEDVTLDFTDERDETCKWVVLLGENGTGKSTILQMVAVSLLGPKLLSVAAGDIQWGAYLRRASEEDIEAEFTAVIQPSEGDFMVEPDIAIYRPGFSFRTVNTTFHFSWSALLIPQISEVIHGEDLHTGWFSCGYSPWRRLSARSNDTVLPLARTDSKSYRFASLFGVESALTISRDWIADLYFRTLHPDRTPHDDRQFRLAINCLERILPDIKFIEVTRDRDVIVKEAGARVSLDRLSDGYRSMTAWVMDLVRRLCDAFPDSGDPLKESGVVLVDEIDLHLHPRWQRSVVETIRKTFPNLQFIVTTHSPFVAQDMTEKDKLIVLKRVEDKRGRKIGPVTVEQGMGFAKNWRADQILTSWLFNLPGTRDDSVLRNEKRYQRLLDREAQGTITDTERKSLQELKQRVENAQGPIGETVNEQELFDAAKTIITAITGYRPEPPKTNRNGSSE